MDETIGGDGTWAERLADMVLAAFHGPVPEDVLDRSALALLDTIACAAGAHDSGPARAARGAIEGSGPPEATVWFEGGLASVEDAVLANGTAVRYLDANDVFLGVGPAGHASDNLPVVVAAAEKSGSSGHDLLVATALAYELMSRMRWTILRRTPHGSEWHEISASSTIAAALYALLLGADHEVLTNAIAIGASKGYALREIRRGHISMLKAAGNSLVARDGVMAAKLAFNGMSGPPLVFEGTAGLVVTMGGNPDDSMVDQLCAPPEWVIRDVSIKAYPAFGTGQAATYAATQISDDLADLDVYEVEQVAVHLPDSSWTRDYMKLPERRAPRTRETADHSFHFLVAVGLLEGDVTQGSYERELWRDDRVRHLMNRTVIVPEENLTEHAVGAFPAIVEVTLTDGQRLHHEVLWTPGSPRNPWGRDELVTKFERLDRVGLSTGRIGRITDEIMGLSGAPGIDGLLETLEPVS